VSVQFDDDQDQSCFDRALSEGQPNKALALFAGLMGKVIVDHLERKFGRNHTATRPWNGQLPSDCPLAKWFLAQLPKSAVAVVGDMVIEHIAGRTEYHYEQGVRYPLEEWQPGYILLRKCSQLPQTLFEGR